MPKPDAPPPADLHAAFLGLAWLGLAFLGGTVTAQDCDRLIQQLGDPEFEVRERAHATLRAMGPVALPALGASREHPDLEVRLRVRSLIDEIRSMDSTLRRLQEDHDLYSSSSREAEKHRRYMNVMEERFRRLQRLRQLTRQFERLRHLYWWEGSQPDLADGDPR